MAENVLQPALTSLIPLQRAHSQQDCLAPKLEGWELFCYSRFPSRAEIALNEYQRAGKQATVPALSFVKISYLVFMPCYL